MNVGGGSGGGGGGGATGGLGGGESANDVLPVEPHEAIRFYSWRGGMSVADEMLLESELPLYDLHYEYPAYARACPARLCTFRSLPRLCLPYVSSAQQAEADGVVRRV